MREGEGYSMYSVLLLLFSQSLDPSFWSLLLQQEEEISRGGHLPIFSVIVIWTAFSFLVLYFSLY